MRTPLLSAGDSNCRLGITRSHNCSDIRFEMTNVLTSCRTAAGESACSSWMTDSMGSNLTKSLYFMAAYTPLVVGARANRDDDGLCLLELNELWVCGFSIGQCAVLKGAVPGSNYCSIAARHLK